MPHTPRSARLAVETIAVLRSDNEAHEQIGGISSVPLSPLEGDDELSDVPDCRLHGTSPV